MSSSRSDTGCPCGPGHLYGLTVSRPFAILPAAVRQDPGSPPVATPAAYTLGEELAHAVTHGVGIVLSIVGLVVLVAAAAAHGDTRDVVGCSVFGVTLVLLYTASTLYHSVRLPRARRLLQVLDHSGIYLLIAGTYTPVVLSKLPGPVGWTLLAAQWIAATVGIVLGATLGRRFRPYELALYPLMGWSVLFVFVPLSRTLAPGGWWLLLAGGLSYTLGMGFYALKRVAYSHAVWHLFVLAGSVLQYLAVLLYVLPRAG